MGWTGKGPSPVPQPQDELPGTYSHSLGEGTRSCGVTLPKGHPASSARLHLLHQCLEGE